MQWPGQKSDSIPAPPRLRSNLEEHRRNKIAIRGAKRRNNKGQVEPRVFPSSSRSSLYASFLVDDELSIRCAPSGKNQRNSRRDPARQSYALFMRIAKCTRASQIRIYYCYSPSIRGKKRAGISRIVRTHNGWLVGNDESELRRFPARNIFQDSRPR